MPAEVRPDHIPEIPQPQVSIDKLLSNAKAALMGAIELHNKPIFPNRYEVVIVLVINAWELAMKAYIIKNHPDQPMFNREGNTMAIDSCLSFIEKKVGKDFLIAKESIELIYEYRCNIIHFYSEDIQPIIFTLLHSNILLLGDFLTNYFGIDLGEEANLVILPIGFKRAVSPIEFLSQQSIDGSEYAKKFVASIIKSAQTLHDNGFDDGLLCNYEVYVGNASRIKNADIVIGITNDPSHAKLMVQRKYVLGNITNDANATKVQLDDAGFKELFPMDRKEFIEAVKKEIPRFKESNKIKTIIKEIRANPNFCYDRPYDLYNKFGQKKAYFNEKAVAELIKKLNNV